MIVGLVGCDADVPIAPDAGADAGVLTQGSPARGDLVINEVAPRPVDGSDWLELYNRSDNVLDACAFFVTDSLDRLDHYTPLSGVLPPEPCAPTPIEPGAYLVVIADNNPDAGIDHARFKLGVADELYVVSRTGVALDGLVYLYPETAAGQSLVRSPNGSGVFFLAEPSPGVSNPAVE